ncbi:lycopene cyclase family protein [Streptomyces sp. TRM 70351]|uniref:lycopene cyclase family protein n=1 Tax=Streptomyces sp. TRM 70351 TaxID=3116552 RepID=UPI002E7BDF82|nr:lycopene cyclase family protein [Streptomyces sp. TRM 70351]MEE1927125.1 lycopene cyclase family protein [Streptomyces sp. TRM 70351]
MRDADVVVVGAGAAGLSLARELTAGSGPGPACSVLLVEPPPGPRRSPERTWCFWGEPGAAPDPLASASWERLAVRGRDGGPVTGSSARRYQMIRSADFTRALDAELAAVPGVARYTGTVTGVADDGPHGAAVSGLDTAGRPFRLRGRWVFDSRPPRVLPPARTTLLQHFRGWFVSTAEDRFDPGTAELMDFRTPQPRRGLSFAYVLPFTPREALVEYTEFSPAPLGDAGYAEALRHYTERVRPLGTFTVTRAEQGVIPMTDAVFPRRAGRSVFRVGTAGGATRPATGYTFAAVRRQSAAIAAAYRAGAAPVPPRPHARRHRAMDAALLRALATGRVDGAAFFEDLFRRNPLERVLRFLDGRSSPAEEVAIGLRSPVLPMARSLAELPLLPRRAPVG